jgi:hypothetical protein
VSVAEQLVGTGTIQASHLVEAGRRLIGLNGDGHDDGGDMTTEQIADMFGLDVDDLMFDDPFEEDESS